MFQVLGRVVMRELLIMYYILELFCSFWLRMEKMVVLFFFIVYLLNLVKIFGFGIFFFLQACEMSFMIFLIMYLQLNLKFRELWMGILLLMLMALRLLLLCFSLQYSLMVFFSLFQQQREFLMLVFMKKWSILSWNLLLFLICFLKKCRIFVCWMLRWEV